jgi:hypothetical protein
VAEDRIELSTSWFSVQRGSHTPTSSAYPVVALAKRSGFARIGVVDDDRLVCAAPGTVTIVLPKT